MKHFFGRKSRSTLTTVLMVSLALHVVIIIIFGTIKLLEVVQREEKVFKPASLEQPLEEVVEEKVDILERNKSSQPPRPEAVVVTNISEVMIPSLGIDVDVDSPSAFPRTGSGLGGLEGVWKKANTAEIFDRQVEAERLGVILDVSFSTHDVLSAVIKEIQSGFPNALIVFTPGCAIDERKTELVPISSYEKTAKKYAEGRYITKNFVDALLKRDDFEKIWKRASRQDNGMVLFANLQGNQGCSGCDVAMKYLADEGADVIYWFADFDDRIDPELAEKAASYLRRKGAKLIIHDFKGELAKGGTKPRLEMMAKKTGGEFFLKLFNKK